MEYKEYDQKSLFELVEAMQGIREKLDIAKDEKTRLQKIYDHLRENKIPEMMDDEGVNSVTYEGIGRVTLTSDIYASIPAIQKDAAWQWLKENNHGGIIKENVHSGTLKATLKAIIKKGKEELPEEIFKVTPFSRASITKVK